MSDQSSLKLSNTTLIECGPHRVCSRSVSWDTLGSFLAMAASDRTVRLWTVENGSREVLVISHGAPVTKVRFHPSESTQLCTASADKTLRLWDVRGASQRALGKIDVLNGATPTSVEWSRSDSHVLAVLELDGMVYVYDVRKLAPATAIEKSPSGRTRPSSALAAFSTKPFVPESFVFSPDGNYLIADSSGENGGALQFWPWKSEPSEPAMTFPSHGPIYAMSFSPDYKFLATGGSDATVGIWSGDSMSCTHTVSRNLKYIRGVAFSHDSKILASSTESESIDLADAFTGDLVGLAPFGQRRSCGAEEIAFHPKEYLLACARIDSPMGSPPSPMTVMKLSFSDAQ